MLTVQDAIDALSKYPRLEPFVTMVPQGGGLSLACEPLFERVEFEPGRGHTVIVEAKQQ